MHWGRAAQLMVLLHCSSDLHHALNQTHWKKVGGPHLGPGLCGFLDVLHCSLLTSEPSCHLVN